MHFLVGDECAVHARRNRGAGRQVQHIAVTEQRLGAALVKNRARVHFGGNLKGDPRRNIGLDQAGDDIHRRALRRQYQMDAGGTGLLREARNQLLDLLAHDHHQIGELVDDDHDERQRSQFRHIFGDHARARLARFSACGSGL